MTKMEDRWLLIDKICGCLGGQSCTVHEGLDKHKMPARRMGRLWKFKRDEVDK